MNKFRFRILFFLMSISLIGIILVQLFWINNSLKKNEEQFKYNTLRALNNVSKKINDLEMLSFYKKYYQIVDSLGKTPKKEQLRKIYILDKDENSNQTLIYSNTIIPEDFGIDGSFFDKKASPHSIKKYVAKRKTEIYKDKNFDSDKLNLNQNKPDYSIEKTVEIEALDKVQFELIFRDIISQRSIYNRINPEMVRAILGNELNISGLKTPFEFAIYSNNLSTKIKSEDFHNDKKKTYSVPVLLDAEGYTKYNLLVTFPFKTKYVFSSLLPIIVLSILFTLIIFLTYTSALKQLITQKQISEIKTDFINNMTHEFKTPIATINLALDAIKNPKIFEDKDKVIKYLQMIKDENKRMHAQVENVLRISRLEKKELDLNKQPFDAHDLIEEAIEHISLIIEDKGGIIYKRYDAIRDTVLVNEDHFMNVLVNILENAIKYTVDIPEIIVSTENIKDFILIKIKDNGIGISKVAQKKVFDKFFREHTGDIHNVKGHGLGLAYVKQILEDHNGQVFVESEKGKGSTFIVKLPLIN